MKTAPKQKPPSTMCSYQGMLLMPSCSKTTAIRPPPRNTLSMVFQEAMPVHSRITAPMAMAMTEVSPMDPGMRPMIMSLKLAETSAC